MRRVASKPEKESPVIDLTGDEDQELSRALQASMEDQGPKFGPSSRAPDPNWAVVPSNVFFSLFLDSRVPNLSYISGRRELWRLT